MNIRIAIETDLPVWRWDRLCNFQARRELAVRFELLATALRDNQMPADSNWVQVGSGISFGEPHGVTDAILAETDPDREL